MGVLLLSICELREALPVFFFFHCFSGHFAASVCICVGMRQDVFKLLFTEVLLFARHHIEHFTHASLFHANGSTRQAIFLSVFKQRN